jgi:hypothetical protein
VTFDYGTKIIRFGDSMVPTGELETDLAALQTFFHGVEGRRQALD